MYDAGSAGMVAVILVVAVIVLQRNDRR